MEVLKINGLSKAKVEGPVPSFPASPPVGEPDTILTRAHQLLGTTYHYVATAKIDQELLAEALTEKYL